MDYIENRGNPHTHRIMAVAAGFYKATALTEHGKLVSWSVGELAQLGLGHGPIPRLLEFEHPYPTFIMVSGGLEHYAALSEDGTVWTWGGGREGVLGHGDEVKRFEPTRICKNGFGGSRAVMVTCGLRHTMVVTADYKLWTFGRGREGQTGLAKSTNISIPQNVLSLCKVNVAMVAGSRYHSIAATTDGDVYTWGLGRYGELGHNEESEWDKKLLPTILDRALFGGSRVLFVAAGEHISGAVTDKGLLYVWGSGLHGQLGLGSTENKPIPTCMSERAFDGAMVSMVSFSNYRSVALTEEGEVWSWGFGREGALGHNTELDIFIPLRVHPEHFDNAKVVTAAIGFNVLAAVTEDGTLYSCGTARHPHQHVPTRVDSNYVQGARIGRWHGLLPEHAVAFAMGLHSRLGGASKDKACSLVSILDDSLVKMVVDLCRDCAAGGCVKLSGVQRLMGGSVN